MKSFLKNFAIIVLGLGTASSAYAVCTGSSPCELPATNNSAASWTASASGMTGIQSLDSVGPSGNQAGSRYYFAAVDSNLGATVAKGGISTTGDGTQVVGSFALNSGSTPGSTVTGGVVQQLLGGQTYFFYAQACPSGALLDSANCSQWAQIGSKSSLAYPSSVFVAPTKPTDATINTIAARTNVPAADINNISQIQLEVDNLISSVNQTNIFITWPGANQANIVDNTMYTAGGGFTPNVKYQYKGQVFYPYGVGVPIAGAQTEGPFWTTPSLPGTISVGNITHCSAQITAQNSAGAPANPSYTTYNLCATGTSGSCLTDLISGATPTDTAVATIVGLTPGTAYTPTGQALVGNGDGTSTGWNSSAVKNGTAFNTSGTAGTFGSANITTTSADFTFSGLDLTGVVGYQMIVNGANFGSQVNTPPVSPIHLSGLTSNTQYTVKIKLFEATCNFTVPTSGVAFTTNASVPANFVLTAPTPNSLNATWTDAVNPPANTAYQLNYCTDLAMTQNCQTFVTGKGSLSATATAGVTPAVTYYAQVKALSVGGGNDSAFIPVPPASATTPPNNSTITITPNPQNVPAGAQQVFTAIVTDFQGNVLAGATVQWSLPGGGGALSGTNPASQITFTAGGTVGNFTLQASKPNYTNGTATIMVIASGPQFNSYTFAMAPGNKGGTLTVVGHDNVVHSITSNFSASDPGVTFTPTSVTSADNISGTTAVTFSKAGTFTLTDNLGSGISSATVVVVPQVLSGLKVCAAGDMSCANTITVQTLQNQQFTATGADQFGNAMTLTSVQWSNATASGANSASFSSPTLGQNIRVTATDPASGKSGFILVNVISFDVSGAIAYPVPYKANQGTGVIHFKGLGSQSSIRIYTASGRRVFDITLSADTYDWPIKNSSGESIASGVYFYVIQSPEGKKNGKLIIIQ